MILGECQVELEERGTAIPVLEIGGQAVLNSETVSPFNAVSHNFGKDVKFKILGFSPSRTVRKDGHIVVSVQVMAGIKTGKITEISSLFLKPIISA